MNDPNAKCSSEISETNNDDNDDSNNDNSSNEFSDGHLASSSSKLSGGSIFADSSCLYQKSNKTTWL